MGTSTIRSSPRPKPAISRSSCPRSSPSLRRLRKLACAGIHVLVLLLEKQVVDGRDISAFTRVFDALCPAMTTRMVLAPNLAEKGRGLGCSRALVGKPLGR